MTEDTPQKIVDAIYAAGADSLSMIDVEAEEADEVYKAAPARIQKLINAAREAGRREERSAAVHAEIE